MGADLTRAQIFPRLRELIQRLAIQGRNDMDTAVDRIGNGVDRRTQDSVTCAPVAGLRYAATGFFCVMPM